MITWPMVALVAIGSGVAVAGAVFGHLDSLMMLGSSIVGGVLGNALPNRSRTANGAQRGPDSH